MSTSTRLSAHQSVRTPWPLVAHDVPTLSDAKRLELTQIASELREEHSVHGVQQCDQVKPGWDGGPIVWFEDHRPIPLTSEEGAHSFQYRSFGLARPEDAYLVSGDRDQRYEQYVCRHAGLGCENLFAVQQHHIAKHRRLASAAAHDEGVLDGLTKLALRHQHLTLAPFIASADAWLLARRISNRTQMTVSVLGPPAQLSRLANDKTWFSDLVTRVLGKGSTPPSVSVYSLSQAVRRLRELALGARRLVLKIPNSAGSMGNRSFDAGIITEYSAREAYDLVREQTASMKWTIGSPLLVSVWEEGAQSSPSVQIWVPHRSEGEPVVDGVFEQALAGAEGQFVGAKPMSKHHHAIDTLTTQAREIAFVLQQMGYLGRISFDALLMRDQADGPAQIHWIEANARWGGTSIPMTIARKLGHGAGTHASLFAKMPSDVSQVNKRAAYAFLNDHRVATHTDHPSGFFVCGLYEEGRAMALTLGPSEGACAKSQERFFSDFTQLR